MATEKRNQVLDRSDSVDITCLIDDNSLDEAICRLTSLRDTYKEECTTLNRTTKFNFDHYGYDGGFDAYIDVWREENDIEYNARIAHEEQIKKNKREAEQKKKDKARAILLATEAEERALLAQLQEKYK